MDDLQALIDAALAAGPPWLYRAAARRLLPLVPRLEDAALERLLGSRDPELARAVRAELSARLEAGGIGPRRAARLLTEPHLADAAARALERWAPRHPLQVLFLLRRRVGLAPAAFRAALQAVPPGRFAGLLRLLKVGVDPAVRGEVVERAVELIGSAEDLGALLAAEAQAQNLPPQVLAALRARIMALASREVRP